MAPASLTEFDLHLFSEGRHFRAYEKMGAHAAERAGVPGTAFAVWAPNAARVSVIGNFNGWDPGAHPMECRNGAGIWQAFVPGAGHGDAYKFKVASRFAGHEADKADPYGFCAEVRPGTASRVWDLSYEWGDGDWMAKRGAAAKPASPMSIYEVHLGSWMRVPEEGNRWLTYREAGQKLADYAARMGYTHVELLPLAEHPFDGSWGYQVTGYFAPTSRFGAPQDFMAMVDTLHRRGIGVILDWVPGHFPKDAHGLHFFDGTHLYEPPDPRIGLHREWGTCSFNYERFEVVNFLLSNALFWLDKYHVDGLRVDAVASMLYRDYARPPGEWLPNRHGGRENLEAIDFLRRFNETVYQEYPDAVTLAEESTDWGGVSRPVYAGGLGFGYKWDMGWMHDTLAYMRRDPVFRRFHHGQLTFRMLYAFSENFVLPLSHDEVVHGKGSLLAQMPGDGWQKFANLRLLLGFMYAQPGKKLLFMGGDIGQPGEWSHDRSVDWHLLDQPPHAGLQRWLRDLNTAYRAEPALHAWDADPRGFDWVDANDSDQSVLSFLRRGPAPEAPVLWILNFTPVPRHDYRVGAPSGGRWTEILNSDATLYGGSGLGNAGGVEADPVGWHGRPQSIRATLPPLGLVAFKPAN